LKKKKERNYPVNRKREQENNYNCHSIKTLEKKKKTIEIIKMYFIASKKECGYLFW
jgi:hypothetical protein